MSSWTLAIAWMLFMSVVFTEMMNWSTCSNGDKSGKSLKMSIITEGLAMILLEA